VVVVSALAAVFNPLLNLAAIPITNQLFNNGAVGAAIVTVLTELILLVGLLRLRPEGVLDRPTAKVLGRTLAASLTMVPVVLALHDTPLAVQILAGVITYAAASVAFRTISIDEIRTFGGVVGRRPAQEGNAIT
jgi:hypothetical protein